MTDLDLNLPNGYRLAPGTTLPELAELLRTELEPVRRRIEIDQVAEFAAKLLDEADLAGKPRPESVIFDAVQAQAEHVGKIMAGEHTCAPTTATVTVTDDPDGGNLYALFDFRDGRYLDAIDDLEIGDYHPYWNEDTIGRRPFGTSSREWARRAETWTRVLRGVDPQNLHSMFQIQIGNPFPSMDVVADSEAVFEAMPTMEQRIHHAMEQLQEAQVFGSMAELVSFTATLPEHHQRIAASLKPITLADLAQGAS